MCLAGIAISQSARFPWVVAANRDEFFDRPAAALTWWQPGADEPALLSGRDLSAGGTWLGLNTLGRFAMVTNVREPLLPLTVSPSRGELVTQWLRRQGADAALLSSSLGVPRHGFNLLVGELTGDTGLWLNNRLAQHRLLDAGVYGLSNAALDTDWPKVTRLKHQLREALRGAHHLSHLVARAFAALADPTPADDADLPATGVTLARERQLSPAFIRIEDAGEGTGASYGTRCSTVVVVEQSGPQRVAHVFERRFGRDGGVEGETAEVLDLPAV